MEQNNDRQQLIKKISKVLGEESVTALLSASNDSLKDSVIQAARNVQEAKQDLDSNPKYQNIIDDKKILESSLREVKKAATAKTKLALLLLQERGAA